jgi:hypothetical protein
LTHPIVWAKMHRPTDAGKSSERREPPWECDDGHDVEDSLPERWREGR